MAKTFDNKGKLSYQQNNHLCTFL